MMSVNVKYAVPFFEVTEMRSSLRFYREGLGFTLKRQWIPEGDEHSPTDGRIHWCWLELGNAAIMLQQFPPQGRAKEKFGAGVSVCFQCEDALALYREFKERGIQAQRPFVGNHMWVVALTDPDGYRINFESTTDAPEESVLEDAAPANSLR